MLSSAQVSLALPWSIVVGKRQRRNTCSHGLVCARNFREPDCHAQTIKLFEGQTCVPGL
uniref:Uncharacterized protein n=1 Tax=Anguilla anguilla TaxID=7936 RepID=A0A0E9X332_ANGAN